MWSVMVAALLAVSPNRAALLDRTADEFDLALRRNDVPALERMLSPDWLIIDSNGNQISRDRFLRVLRSGELSHSAMQSSEARVRIYGDSAVLTARADGQGTYRGNSFQFSERSTDVWLWVDGRWLCVLTQLTRISSPQR
jgi:ketosteroid isomerase-like protein